ncbi:alternate-type signal peptide domain-containing protein [Marmoricola sp. RAF53]|uniref:alternate-type signal peptide domain-containing protein n=1 Tax=Marmoricola sp. RAF53 TaxID=3233059 RepID=UPI003F9D797D
MKKSTKGALAAAAAGTLLLGGAGSLAYWTETRTVAGSDLNAGHLNLSSQTCDGVWTLDSGESAPATYTEGDPLVPGDVLSRTCTYTIAASGNHLRATVGATDSSVTGGLAGTFTVGTTDVTVGGNPVTEITEANDGDTLSVTVTATFNSGVTDHEDASGSLSDVTVTLSQVHA